jgi:nicotinate-nucleotide pyrophosphorylase
MDDLQTFLNIREILVKFLQEDVGAGDITSDNIICADMEAKAEIVCKSRFAIVCGLEEASMLFDICGYECVRLCQSYPQGRKDSA